MKKLSKEEANVIEMVENRAKEDMKDLNRRLAEKSVDPKNLRRVIFPVRVGDIKSPEDLQKVIDRHIDELRRKNN